MPEIDQLAFAATLPKTNGRRSHLIKTVSTFNKLLRFDSLRFAQKGRDLLEIVQTFTQQRTNPVVDKKLGFVFGVPEGFHEKFRGSLYAYHDPEDAKEWSETVNARHYVTRGCGYYISSMQPQTIVCGENYKEDRWDKDLFLMLNIFRDPVGR